MPTISIPYRQVEIAIEKSGVPYVILRPNWFADNFHIFWKAGIDHGVIAVPAAEGKTSFIDSRDIAASAAAALTSSRFDGKAFNLTGPAALSYGEAAEILSAVLGRKIAYQPLDHRGLRHDAHGCRRTRRLCEFPRCDLPSRPRRLDARVTEDVTHAHRPRAAQLAQLCRGQQGALLA